MKPELTPGAPCSVNGRRDLAMGEDARPFIGAPCVIVKRCKSGLIQVALVADPKRLYSVPLRNVELEVIRHTT